MRGPVQAMLVTAALAITSLVPILGMVSVLSGAAVALATLRHGARQGMIVILGASVLVGICMYFVFGTVMVTSVFTIMLWLPLWGLALVLRSTASWDKLLDVTALIGVIGAALFYLALPDPATFWHDVMSQALKMMAEQSGAELMPIEHQIDTLAEWMTGLLASGMVISYISSIAVARWWQAMLYNPGGFKQEFQALRLSRNAAYALMVVVVLTALDLGSVSAWASDAVMIAFAVYGVVGIAIAHAVVNLTGRSKSWLVALYVLMFLLPLQVAMVLAVAGVADAWLDFRGRLSAAIKAGGNRHDNQ